MLKNMSPISKKQVAILACFVGIIVGESSAHSSICDPCQVPTPCLPCYSEPPPPPCCDTHVCYNPCPPPAQLPYWPLPPPPPTPPPPPPPPRPQCPECPATCPPCITQFPNYIGQVYLQPHPRFTFPYYHPSMYQQNSIPRPYPVVLPPAYQNQMSYHNPSFPQYQRPAISPPRSLQSNLPIMAHPASAPGQYYGRRRRRRSSSNTPIISSNNNKPFVISSIVATNSSSLPQGHPQPHIINDRFHDGRNSSRNPLRS